MGGQTPRVMSWKDGSQSWISWGLACCWDSWGQKWASTGEGQRLVAQAVSGPCASRPHGSLIIAYVRKWLIARALWMPTLKRKVREVSLKFCPSANTESPWPSLFKTKYMSQNTQPRTEPADLARCCFPGPAHLTWLLIGVVDTRTGGKWEPLIDKWNY